MKDSDGEDRRNNIERDRLLTRIDANLDNLIKSVEAHVLADAKAFEKQDNKIGWLQKITFMGLGVVAFLKLFYK